MLPMNGPMSLTLPLLSLAKFNGSFEILRDTVLLSNENLGSATAQKDKETICMSDLSNQSPPRVTNHFVVVVVYTICM